MLSLKGNSPDDIPYLDLWAQILKLIKFFMLFGVTYSVNQKLPVKTSKIVPDTYRLD